MKSKFGYVFIIATCVMLTLGAMTAALAGGETGIGVAEGVTVTINDGKSGLAAALIALAAPLVTAVVKWLWVKIPTGLIPIICSVAGLLIALAAHYVAGWSVTWWQGLLLGIAGIGVREIVDRGKQVVSPPPI
jgi:hypothetical protein